MNKSMPFQLFMVLVLAILFTAVFGAPAQAKTTLYENIFPDIDLNILEEENYLQYQWQIKPGGDILAIGFENKSTDAMEMGHWSYQKPLASQVIDGRNVEVEVDQVLIGTRFGFTVGNYNKNAQLIIRCDAERCFSDPGAASGSSALPSAGTTYYIRADGGTATQCTGTADAPYPGGGSNQPCAWSHPFWALDGDGQWKIKGGDAIIIAAGSYKMGYGAPNTSWCTAGAAFGCVLPPLPPGPNANNPTRILGKGWDSNCPNAPELWGSQRPWQIIDLTGSSNVYIGCLEITDHSSCIEFHANPAVQCQRDSYPYGDWASEGILASDAANVTLKHLDIHGLASVGIRAGRISNWTVENVRVAGNGWVGWEGDLIDEDDSNSGTLTFKHFTVEWNGCGETYPGEQPHNCWSQTAGGYGDGFGTGTTGGHWIFEDSIFRYNTSDGLDLLYARNSGSRIEIKRTMAYGNAGNAIKVNGSTTIENTLMVGNCGFFHGKSFTYNVDDCRAQGSPLSFSLRKGAAFSLVNSTIVGQGDCLMGGECDDGSCDGSEKIIIANNAFQGFPDYQDPSDTTCYLWLDRFDFYNLRMDYNILYKIKIADQLTLSAHDIEKDPLFVNAGLESFDGHLKSGSPAIDSGLAVGSLNDLIPADDLEGNGRPAGPGVDRGAYEYRGGSPTKPVIRLNRSQLFFGAYGSTVDTGAQVLLISNSGGGELDWSAAAQPSWLRCTPASGSGAGVVTVSVDPTGLSTGSYTGAATITDPNAANSPQTVAVNLIVYAAGGTSLPFGFFETPTEGAVVDGSIPVTGWTLDDIKVSGVEIYLQQNSSSAYIGEAVFVEGARPDVETAYPGYPMNYRAGWGYMLLTNFLPGGGNGTYTFQATAVDAEGNRVSLGIKTITCDNAHAVKPFGAIDTPAQGGIASGGNFMSWGWALTPRPNIIPTDGSSIGIYVDGLSVGHPTYNLYRSDVAGLFPGYANAGGAGGYFNLDTTGYENGVHTIHWTAADDAGNIDGIGSRFFSIQNPGNRRQASGGKSDAAELIKVSSYDLNPITIKKGWEKKNEPLEVSPDDKGKITIEIKELERLEVYLDNLGRGEQEVGGRKWWGCQEIGKQSRPLPIGSYLDKERGVFYWQPGPGFLGEYRLVFIEEGDPGAVKKCDLVINIIPKF